MVHTLPVVSDILSAHPDAQIDWLVEAPFAAIARLHPGVRRVILWPGAMAQVLLRRDTWRAMGELRQALKAEAYDAVIDLQGLLKSVMWARMARGPLHGYDAASIREPLASRFMPMRTPWPATSRRSCGRGFGGSGVRAACAHGRPPVRRSSPSGRVARPSGRRPVRRADPLRQPPGQALARGVVAAGGSAPAG